MYTVGNLKYDPNSAANQAIKKRFISREILTEATDLINFVLECSLDNMKSPMRWESEMERPTRAFCPFCGEKLNLEGTDTMDESIEIHFDETADPEDAYLCPVCMSGWATELDARKCCHHKDIYVCENCLSAVADDNVDYTDEVGDPKEWWLVTDWLAKKLVEKGCLVLESDDFVYAWGKMNLDDMLEDETISAICADLEILEGQKKYREVK